MADFARSGRQVDRPLTLRTCRERTLGVKAQTGGSSTTLGDPTMQTDHAGQTNRHPTPWNKGRLIGPKPPFKRKELWTIRIRLQLAGRTRDLALFNLAIDSKLRGCDLVNLRVGDVAHGGCAAPKRPLSTDRPRTFEPSNCYWVTPNSKAQYGTWVSRSTTPWRWLSSLKSEASLAGRGSWRRSFPASRGPLI